jgi:hypothetical protein
MVDDAELEIAAPVGPLGEVVVEPNLDPGLGGLADDPEVALGDTRHRNRNLGPGWRRGQSRRHENQTNATHPTRLALMGAILHGPANRQWAGSASDSLTRA